MYKKLQNAYDMQKYIKYLKYDIYDIYDFLAILNNRI